MKFAGAEIITPLSEIEKMVLKECVKELNKILPSVGNLVATELKNNIISIFRTSPEYKSLVGGDLTGQFGLVDAQLKVDSIVKKLSDSVEVVTTKCSVRGNTLHGGFKIQAIQSDFADILAMDEAFQPIDSGSFLRLRMPWLEWLLLEGDRIIIADYYFKPGSFSNSRSGRGIMVFNKKEYWKVPSQYAGTAANNWVTRTVDTYLNFLSQIIEKTVKQYL